MKEKKRYLNLLQDLIQTPSLSGDEGKTADLLAGFLEKNGISTQRNKNNIWALNRYFDIKKPTILLNSHHDTVKPNSAYTRHPFTAEIANGKLYGLGSNDAGGALIALLATFMHFYENRHLKYNLIWAGTAEEEISGKDGLERIIPQLPELAFAIVGEPTQMNMAVAEKGLIVLDCTVRGKTGHAARNEGINAIYKALEDIHWFKTYSFSKESPFLGTVKMSVTTIEAGRQHNVVPEICKFTVDVRTTECYTNEEILETIRKYVGSEINPRSLRLKPSFIDLQHPLVRSGSALGLKTYGSPTTSDQALLSIPSLKIGPGDSARSHTADEFIYVDEFYRGMELYIHLLENITL